MQFHPSHHTHVGIILLNNNYDKLIICHQYNTKSIIDITILGIRYNFINHNYTTYTILILIIR